MPKIIDVIFEEGTQVRAIDPITQKIVALCTSGEVTPDKRIYRLTFNEEELS